MQFALTGENSQAMAKQGGKGKEEEVEEEGKESLSRTALTDAYAAPIDYNSENNPPILTAIWTFCEQNQARSKTTPAI